MFLKCSISKRMFPDMLHQENVTSQCFRPIKTKKFDKVDVSFSHSDEDVADDQELTISLRVCYVLESDLLGSCKRFPVDLPRDLSPSRPLCCIGMVRQRTEV